MYAAGKRKVRPPVRFQDYATEHMAQYRAQSTPTERRDTVPTPTVRRDPNPTAAQSTWMQQELQNVSHDLEQLQLELGYLENRQQGPNGITPIKQDPPTANSSARVRSFGSGVTGQQTQFAEDSASRPSLQDICAMNRLAGHDPLQQYDMQAVLPRSGGTDARNPVVATDFPAVPVEPAPLPRFEGANLHFRQRPVRAQPPQDSRGTAKIVSGS
ncbi:PREDICTED: uncharacterized protein LOC109474750 [Branchiostoma belcheri]|uniref:Uncharacterized protein LOC109474750 n=1 Tax=Branchiostoma belcheri TaxID=7741 RepID=A0A6P4Z2A1_BRABE|nr:PREDICTED: uncharacterized protein LOC109474750 [Branchiostoma belcheri]